MKNSFASIFLACCTVLLSAQICYAQFKVGDRVQVGDGGEFGTVIEMGPSMFDGGNEVKVHLDRFGDAFPNAGVIYDPKRSKLKPAGGGPAGNKNPTANTQAGEPRMAAPMTNGGNLNQPANGVNTAFEAAKNFLKGQRVFIGNMKEWGTVIGPGAGPNLVRVHLDRFDNPGSSVDFDPIASKVASAGTPGVPADTGRGGGASNGTGGGVGNGKPAGNGGNTAADQNPGPGVDKQVPPNAPPNAETFKKVIESKFPQPGWGDTLSFDFQTFSVSGPMTHTVKYEGHLDQETILGGSGRPVTAWKVHTKYKQITHYKDVHADDQYNVKEGDYWIYKDPHGFWVAEGENVQLDQLNT